MSKLVTDEDLARARSDPDFRQRFYADHLDRLLRAEGFAGAVRAGGIEEAVDRGLALAPPGGVLLLSPGHASYGMFVNYEERGDRFREAVRRRAGARDR